MARKRNRNRREEYGEVIFDANGRPIAFKPLGGVRYRLRDFFALDGLYQKGKVSPEDYQQARDYFNGQK